MKRRLVMAMLLQFLAKATLAAAFSSFAVPTLIEVERGGGFTVYGNFGNPGGRTNANMLYIRNDHPQYKEVYAAALAAFAGKYRIRAYVSTCQPVSWYTNSPDTLNIVDANSVVSVLD